MGNRRVQKAQKNKYCHHVGAFLFSLPSPLHDGRVDGKPYRYPAAAESQKGFLAHRGRSRTAGIIMGMPLTPAGPDKLIQINLI
jgi:hypothetical protein